jgi:hypothetical protein
MLSNLKRPFNAREVTTWSEKKTAPRAVRAREKRQDTKDKTRINCFGQTLLDVCRLIIVYMNNIIHAARKKFLVIGETAKKSAEVISVFTLRCAGVKVDWTKLMRIGAKSKRIERNT